MDAYRGAGRPEATFVVERIVETAARELGRDPAELRRLNMIQPEDFPYETPVALVYDTGDYEASLDKALNWPTTGVSRRAGAHLRRRASAGHRLRLLYRSPAASRLRSSPSPLGPEWPLREREVRINPTGSVSVFTGAHSHGPGPRDHLCPGGSDKLGIPFDDIEIVHGDTGRRWNSAWAPMVPGRGGGRLRLIVAADKIIARARRSPRT